MITLSSPNFNDRLDGVVIDSVIIHYTGMKSCQDALDRLCDPAAKASAHYQIDEDGTLYQLVPPQKRAWHAGVSEFGGRTNFNDFSIGIELVNPGHEHGYRPFPDVQIDALMDLMRGLFSQFPINPKWVLGHEDIAPTRKQDPGELFPWKRLETAGFAIRPSL